MSADTKEGVKNEKEHQRDEKGNMSKVLEQINTICGNFERSKNSMTRTDSNDHGMATTEEGNHGSSVAPDVALNAKSTSKTVA